MEEAQARLSLLAQNKKLWIQEMYLDVGTEAIHLRDIQSQVRTDNLMVNRSVGAERDRASMTLYSELLV